MHKAARIIAILTVLATLTAAFLPTPVYADGGPAVPDWQMWQTLKEGEQTAVVNIGVDGRAHTDLFVSFMNSSSEPETFTYFIPLGFSSSNFSAADSTTESFGSQYLTPLDNALKDQAQNKQSIVWALAPGLMAAQGAVFAPAAFFLFTAGCGSSKPEATFTTGSSQIELFNLVPGADLGALIDTAGLDPLVTQTLARLTGQQIAVIQMRTAPGMDSGVRSSYPAVNLPGLHLSWDTEPATARGKLIVTYPLNTGAAWAHPIDLTSVYIVAPSSLNFGVSYPKLGADRSGYTTSIFGFPRLKIASNYSSTAPAYAVENAVTTQGHIWRVIYTQSNPDKDIVVTLGGSGLSMLRLSSAVTAHPGWVLLFGLLVSWVLWMLSWRYLLPRLLPLQYSWRNGRMWRDAAFLPLLNLLFGLVLIIALPVALIAFTAIPGSAALHSGDVIVEIGVVIAALAIFLLVLWVSFGTSIKRLEAAAEVSKGRAVKAYILHALAASLGYLALMLVFGAVVGII